MTKFEKFWSGNCNFTAKETFTDLNAAAKAGLPGATATYEVDPKSIGFEFKRVKEVKTNVDTNNVRDRVRENESKDGGSTEKKKTHLAKDNST